MKAVVLTYDKYKVFADHMIYKYQQLWPDNPFIFRIPYQNEEIKDYFENKYGNKVELMKSPPGIVDTVDTLLVDIDDDEWIYWCMDDRYPIIIDQGKMNDMVLSISQNNLNNSIKGLRCINYPFGRMPENIYWFKYSIIIRGIKFYKRKNNYNMIWAHQFLKTGVIKVLFSNIPNNLKAAKEMDYIVENLRLPRNQNLYVVRKNLIELGESTSRGKITQNCFESLNKLCFSIPKTFDIDPIAKLYYDKFPLVKTTYVFVKWVIKRGLKFFKII